MLQTAQVFCLAVRGAEDHWVQSFAMDAPTPLHNFFAEIHPYLRLFSSRSAPTQLAPLGIICCLSGS